MISNQRLKFLLLWNDKSRTQVQLSIVYYEIGIPIDIGMGLSITIDKIRVFINKTLSTKSLTNQLSIKRVDSSISIDSR